MSKSYGFRVLIAVDQLFNVVLLNGSEDHTISGRVGYLSFVTGKRRWKMMEWCINKLFWFDSNHCYNSIEWDEVSKQDRKTDEK